MRAGNLSIIPEDAAEERLEVGVEPGVEVGIEGRIY